MRVSKRRFTSLLLALGLVLSLVPMPVSAQGGLASAPGVRSIEPSKGTPLHTYRFFKTEDEANRAQSDPSTGVAPLSVQRVRTNSVLFDLKLTERKDHRFLGWFYKDNGKEKQVEFNKGVYVDQDREFFCYPKYEEIHCVFFADGNTIVDTANADDVHEVPISEQPNVQSKDRILVGWDYDNDGTQTRFHFKENAPATKVSGSLVLKAVYKPSIHISFATDGGNNIDGVYLSSPDQKVAVPSDPVRDGYTFSYWYVKVNKPDPVTGENKIQEERLTASPGSDGKLYFNRTFPEATTIYAKWQAKDVKFTVLFYTEKISEHTTDENAPRAYEFFASFQNDNDPSLLITQGRAGSKISVVDKNAPPNSDEDTFIDGEKFSNLDAYAKKMPTVDDRAFVGFHLNVERSNSENKCLKDDGNGGCAEVKRIDGAGTTAIKIYLDRDQVNLRVKDQDGKVYTNAPKVSGDIEEPLFKNLKYGQVVDAAAWTRIRTIVQTKNNTTVKALPRVNMPGNDEVAIMPYKLRDFSNPPSNTRTVCEKLPRDGSKPPSWESRLIPYNTSKTWKDALVGVKVAVPEEMRDNANLTYANVIKWINDNPDLAKVRFLDKGVMAGPLSAGVRLTAGDAVPMEGYSTAGVMNDSSAFGTRTSGTDYAPTYKAAHELIINWYNAHRPAGTDAAKIPLKNDSAYTNDFSFALFFTRNQWSITFDTQTSTPGLENKTIKNLLYGTQWIGGQGYNKNVKEDEFKQYYDSFVKAVEDPDTHEVVNYEQCTKDSANGYLFKGWYYDATYTVPFDPATTVPDRNVIVYAKWEPIYHYVKVHKLPYGAAGSWNKDNINEIKVPHDGKVSSTDPKLEYLLPQGSTKDQFQGWETYGDVDKEKPSINGQGSPFMYRFDSLVKTGFHLFPKWEGKQARVVYLYNYNDDFDHPVGDDDFKDVMSRLNADGEYRKDSALYMSAYQYKLDSELRLRAPLGFTSDDLVVEPEGQNGTKTEGKIFRGWRIFVHDYNENTWKPLDTISYRYNDRFVISKNSVTYNTGASQSDSLGAIFFVATWGRPEPKTTLTLHSNDGTHNTEIVEKDIVINDKYRLPSIKELIADGHSEYDRDAEKIQFRGWNTRADGTGRRYQNAEEILVDNQFEQEANHLYAQWRPYYDITARKIWNGVDAGQAPRVGVGLMRRVAVGPPDNPGFASSAGFEPVAGSIQYFDAPDKVLTWKVPGHNPDGKRYAYITAEVKPGDEARFYNATSFQDLRITTDSKTRTKRQLVDLGDPVDTYSAATMRYNKEGEYDRVEDEVLGYDFYITNDKIVVPAPTLAQAYDKDKTLIVTPPNQDDVSSMTVTMPNGDTIDYTKDKNGTWSTSNAKYPSVDDRGQITITLPADSPLVTNQVVKAYVTNADGVKSSETTMTVKKRPDSVPTDKPAQGRRDGDNNVTITATPGTKPVAPGTDFVLTDESGQPIKGSDGQPIHGSVDQNGKVHFAVPDGVLKDGQTVKIQTTEPGKEPALSEASAPLDLAGPVLTADHVTGKVGIALPAGDKAFKIHANEEATILDVSNMPSDVVVNEQNASLKTEWTFGGTGRFETEREATIKAEDRFGNVATATFKVTITKNDVTGRPTIDQPKAGDTEVKVTPPADADTMTMTFPDGSKVELKKNADGQWVDGNNKTYPPDGNGRLTIPVPNGQTLKTDDTVGVTAQDKAHGKEPSSASAVVKPRGGQMPPPTIHPLHAGDQTIGMTPVNDADGHAPDRMTVSVQQDNKETVIALTKDKASGEWVWIENGQEKARVKPNADGRIDIPVPPGITLAVGDSVSATEQNDELGIAASRPTSVIVNANPSDVPTTTQGQTTDKGDPTVTGTGKPGATIVIRDKDNNVIGGPVLVKDDGTYTVTIPKDKMPADNTVDVYQKEDGKPESKKAPITLDTTPPKAPVLDQPLYESTTVKLKPDPSNEPGDQLIVSLPGDKTIVLTKQKDGTWKDEASGTTYTPDGDGKISPTLPDGLTLKDNDQVSVIARDPLNNKTAPDTKTVKAEPSFKAGKPKQEGKDDQGRVIVTSEIPAGVTPEPGTTYTLTDDNGQPILDKDGKPITGTVNKDGKIEFHVPEGTLPENKPVKVQVKEPHKTPTLSDPSDPIDTTAPAKPTITKPYSDDRSIEVTPPSDPDVATIDVTIPGKDGADPKVITLTKKPDGTYESNDPIYPATTKDGKVTIGLPDGVTLAPNDTITATASDAHGNRSDADKQTVEKRPESRKADTPTQGVRTPENEVVVTSQVPMSPAPADGTTYTLTDENGKPIVDKNGTPITATPDKDGHLVYKVPDGILKDGQKVKVEVKEPGKTPTTSDPSAPLDLAPPVITTEDVTGYVGVPIDAKTITTNEPATLEQTPDLPRDLTLNPSGSEKKAWTISGTSQVLVNGEKHTVTAVDAFGNKASATYTVTITDNPNVTDPPTIGTVTAGDKTIAVTPPASGADTIVVTLPNGDRLTLTKASDGAFTLNGTPVPVKDGALQVPVPDGVTLKDRDVIRATAEDKANHKKVSKEATSVVGPEATAAPTPVKQSETDKDNNPTLTGDGTPGATVVVKDKNGNVIAGPVVVDKDGHFKVTVPKDKVPADGNVDVHQKEDGKPESPATPVTIDAKAPAAPTLDQPKPGDTTVTVTPPSDPDTKTITLKGPGNTTITLTKQPDGTWSDGHTAITPDSHGKLVVPLPNSLVLKSGDEITATAADGYGNRSPEARQVVPDTAKPAKPEIRQPMEGDRTLIVTPPSDPDLKSVVVTMPDGTKVTVTRGDNDSWTSDNPNYPVSGNRNEIKMELPTPVNKDDVFKGEAVDTAGNVSDPAEVKAQGALKILIDTVRTKDGAAASQDAILNAVTIEHVPTGMSAPTKALKAYHPGDPEAVVTITATYRGKTETWDVKVPVITDDGTDYRPQTNGIVVSVPAANPLSLTKADVAKVSRLLAAGGKDITASAKPTIDDAALKAINDRIKALSEKVACGLPAAPESHAVPVTYSVNDTVTDKTPTRADEVLKTIDQTAEHPLIMYDEGNYPQQTNDVVTDMLLGYGVTDGYAIAFERAGSRAEGCWAKVTFDKDGSYFKVNVPFDQPTAAVRAARTAPSTVSTSATSANATASAVLDMAPDPTRQPLRIDVPQGAYRYEKGPAKTVTRTLTYTIATPVLLVPDDPEGYLALAKTASVREAYPGQTYTYTFVLVNNGKTALRHIKVSDAMLNMKDVEMTQNGEPLTLAPGEEFRYDVSYTVPNTAKVGDTLANTATAKAETYCPKEPDEKGVEVASNDSTVKVQIVSKPVAPTTPPTEPTEPTPPPSGPTTPPSVTPGPTVVPPTAGPTTPGGGHRPTPGGGSTPATGEAPYTPLLGLCLLALSGLVLGLKARLRGSRDDA